MPMQIVADASGSGSSVYRVSIVTIGMAGVQRGDSFACGCPAWTRTTPRADCKHILRVKLSATSPTVRDPSVRFAGDNALALVRVAVGFTPAEADAARARRELAEAQARISEITNMIPAGLQALTVVVQPARSRPYAPPTGARVPPATRCIFNGCKADHVQGAQFCAAHAPKPPKPTERKPTPPEAETANRMRMIEMDHGPEVGAHGSGYDPGNRMRMIELD